MNQYGGEGPSRTRRRQSPASRSSSPCLLRGGPGGDIADDAVGGNEDGDASSGSCPPCGLCSSGSDGPIGDYDEWTDDEGNDESIFDVFQMRCDDVPGDPRGDVVGTPRLAVAMIRWSRHRATLVGICPAG